MAHKRHTPAATEQLVHFDMASRTLQQCRNRLDKRQDEVGDVTAVRKDLTDARELICAAADLLEGARDLTTPQHIAAPRLQISLSLSVIAFVFVRGAVEAVNDRWGWVAVLVAMVVLLALFYLLYWAVGRVLRFSDYRSTIRLAEYRDDPVQHGETAADDATREWVVDTLLDDTGDAGTHVLAGVAATVVGPPPLPSWRQHVPLPSMVDLQFRLFSARGVLAEVAQGLHPKRDRWAYDLLVRANDATFRAEATLIHAVTEIRRHVESRTAVGDAPT